MKHWALAVLVACTLAPGCDDDNPAGPSTAPLVFTAQLSPANEVPAIANAESSGRGAVQITFTPTRDSSGAITGGTAAFHFQVSEFPNTTRIVAAHIHRAAAGVNGPIVVDTGITAGTSIALPNGSATFDAGNIVLNAAIINEILGNPAGFYFNVHSTVNPGGFTRGQLVRTQ